MKREEFDDFAKWFRKQRLLMTSFLLVIVFAILGGLAMAINSAITGHDTYNWNTNVQTVHKAVWDLRFVIYPVLVGLIPAALALPNQLLLAVRRGAERWSESEYVKRRRAEAALAAAEAETDRLERQYELGKYTQD